MRQYRSPRCAREPRIESLVHCGYHIGNVPLTAFEQIHYLPLPLPPVPDHTTHQLTGIFHCRTMGRIINPVFAVIELLQACHIIAHVAVGGTDHARRPFHDMIARKKGTTFNQRVANMVRCVSGRGYGLQRPAVAGNLFAVRQNPVGRIIGIEGAIRTRAVIFQDQGRASNDGRTGCQL